MIQPDNPLHGVTLAQLLNELVSFYGWDALGRKIEIRCFTHDPSIASSLKFLRRTPLGTGACGIAVYRNGSRQG